MKFPINPITACPRRHNSLPFKAMCISLENIFLQNWIKRLRRVFEGQPIDRIIIVHLRPAMCVRINGAQKSQFIAVDTLPIKILFTIQIAAEVAHKASFLRRRFLASPDNGGVRSLDGTVSFDVFVLVPNQQLFDVIFVLIKLVVVDKGQVFVADHVVDLLEVLEGRRPVRGHSAGLGVVIKTHFASEQRNKTVGSLELGRRGQKTLVNLVEGSRRHRLPEGRGGLRASDRDWR